MAARISSLFFGLLGVGIIVLGAWAIIQGIQAEPGLVGSVLTATLGFVAVALDHQRQQRRETSEAHKAKLLPFYEGLVEKLGEATDDQGNIKPDVAEFVQKLQQELVLSGSASVVRAYVTWLRIAAVQATLEEQGMQGAPGVALFAYEDLLKAIRADLGHDDSKLKRGDVLRLLVNDIDEHLPQQG